MDKLIEILSGLASWIRTQAPALAILFFNYEESKIQRLKNDKDAVELELSKERNTDAVEQQNHGRSPVDLVNDAIRDGGGTPADLISDPKAPGDPDSSKN
jgi:hypothetical protein